MIRRVLKGRNVKHTCGHFWDLTLMSKFHRIHLCDDNVSTFDIVCQLLE